jgi:hypothetical protein
MLARPLLVKDIAEIEQVVETAQVDSIYIYKQRGNGSCKHVIREDVWGDICKSYYLVYLDHSSHVLLLCFSVPVVSQSFWT